MEKITGKFIVIDGTDGSGKTTQLNLLKNKLETEGYAVEVADFPQYNTKSAGLVEEYLSGKYGSAEEVDPYKASIFYAVDRFDASAKIKQWLNEGKIVLANRYTSASLGHQGGKIDNPLERKIFFNWLYDLEYKIFEIPKPDLTLILQVEPEISFNLAKNRGREDWHGKTNDIHENNFNHLKKAEQTYLEIASSLSGFRLIKCTHNNEILSPEAIHFLVWLAASQLVIHQVKTKPDFQAIGNIIGSNQQIVKNRELILNNSYQSGNNVINNSNPPISINPPANLPIKEDGGLKDVASLPEEKIINILPTVAIEKITATAKLPQQAHPGDAGYDLYADDYYSIMPYGQALVSTGIKLAIPEGYVGLIWDKSGLANEGITTMGGVIDSGYRGEIKIIIKNLSEDIFNISAGHKIAQILIQPVATVSIKEEKIDITTKRQDQGFGSTGKF